MEEVFDKKPQKNASVVPVPTTFFSPKQMRRIMAHVTSLHDIRISHPSVKAVSIAMEHFIRTFIQEAYRHAQRSVSPRTVVDYEDLSYVAQHFTSLYFLQDFVPLHKPRTWSCEPCWRTTATTSILTYSETSVLGVTPSKACISCCVFQASVADERSKGQYRCCSQTWVFQLQLTSSSERIESCRSACWSSLERYT